MNMGIKSIDRKLAIPRKYAMTYPISVGYTMQLCVGGGCYIGHRKRWIWKRDQRVRRTSWQSKTSEWTERGGYNEADIQSPKLKK